MNLMWKQIGSRFTYSDYRHSIVYPEKNPHIGGDVFDVWDYIDDCAVPFWRFHDQLSQSTMRMIRIREREQET